MNMEQNPKHFLNFLYFSKYFFVIKKHISWKEHCNQNENIDSVSIKTLFKGSIYP